MRWWVCLLSLMVGCAGRDDTRLTLVFEPRGFVPSDVASLEIRVGDRVDRLRIARGGFAPSALPWTYVVLPVDAQSPGRLYAEVRVQFQSEPSWILYSLEADFVRGEQREVQVVLDARCRRATAQNPCNDSSTCSSAGACIPRLHSTSSAQTDAGMDALSTMDGRIGSDVLVDVRQDNFDAVVPDAAEVVVPLDVADVFLLDRSETATDTIPPLDQMEEAIPADVLPDLPEEISCGSGLTLCAGRCVDLNTDNANCGRCANACSAMSACQSGGCRVVCPPGQTACTTGTSTSCTNLNTDNTNCGACGNSCTGGTACTSGACQCPVGQVLCSGVCVNTQSNTLHCGACGRTCLANQMCSSGVCVANCALPNIVCGSGAMSACVDPRTDVANCGMCGRSCAAGQVCSNSVCACPAGLTPCGATSLCVDLLANIQNCGACGVTCPAGQSCVLGMCSSAGPTNDLRANAVNIPTNVPSSSYTVNLSSATSNTALPPTCSPSCAMGGDVFYRFTLTQPELVYADSFGSNMGSMNTTNTVLFLQDSAGNNIPDNPTNGVFACNDDQTDCVTGVASSRDSRIFARLNAGTYYLVLKSCSAVASSANVNFQHLPVGNGTLRRIAPSTTMQSATGTTTGTGILTGTCSSAGPEDTLYFLTCPTDTARVLHASTCGGASFDTSLYQRSALRSGEVCNDDQGSTCGQRSAFSAQVPAGAGLHAMYVDGSISTSAGPYTVQYRLDMCNAGFTLCSGTCLETARFQTDDQNCGACGNVCGIGTTCRTGVCRPLNDECSAATSIPLPVPGSTTMVTGSITNATASVGSPSSGTGGDVWYTITTTARELIYLNTFGSTFDTSIAIGDACGSAAVATNDDSSCGTSCTPGSGCDFRSSHLAVILDPGVHYINVRSAVVGAVGNLTLRVQRINNVVGPSGVPNSIPQGTFSLAASTVGAPTRLATCSGSTTASPEINYVWLSCPAASSATFTARTCTAASYDTVLEYRSSLGAPTGTSCNDDNSSICSATGADRRSAISVTVRAGAGAHLLNLNGIAGASGTATITGTRP